MPQPGIRQNYFMTKKDPPEYERKKCKDKSVRDQRGKKVREGGG